MSIKIKLQGCYLHVNEDLINLCVQVQSYNVKFNMSSTVCAMEVYIYVQPFRCLYYLLSLNFYFTQIIFDCYLYSLVLFSKMCIRFRYDDDCYNMGLQLPLKTLVFLQIQWFKCNILFLTMLTRCSRCVCVCVVCVISCTNIVGQTN